MDKCKYELSIDNTVLKFDSEQELSKYIKQNMDNSTSIRHSLEMSDRAIVIKGVIEKNIAKGYDAIDAPIRRDFLKLKHNIGDGIPKLLSPELDVNFYTSNALAKEIEDNRVKGIELSDIDKDLFSKNILEALDSDDIMQSVSAQIRKISTNFLLDNKSYLSEIDSFITFIDNHNKNSAKFSGYSVKDKEDIKKNIINQLHNYKFSINSISKNTLINKKFSSKGKEVKDIIDVLAIDNSGIPNIIHTTVSRKSYSNWNSAKKREYDYRLGIQRQLIENIVPTNNSGLFIAPFILPTIEDILDLNNFMFDSLKRKDITPDLDFERGTISKNLRVLIPTSFTEYHVTSNSDVYNDKLIAAIFPTSYIFRSKFIVTSKENLIKKVLNKQNDAGEYILYDAIEGRNVTIKTAEEVDTVVEAYIVKQEANKNSKIQQLKSVIQQKIANKEESSIIFTNTVDGDKIINNIFKKYLHGAWELVDNDIFTNQDQLVFRNTQYKTIEVVSLTANDLKDVHNLGMGNSLLGKFKKTSDNNKILLATTSNIEIIKTLSILNNMPELFKNYKLGNIHTINIIDGKANFNDLELLIYNFNELFNTVNSPELGISNNFANGKIVVSDRFIEFHAQILHVMSNSTNAEIRNTIKANKVDVAVASLDWLMQIKTVILSQYPHLKSMESQAGITSDEAYLLYLVNQGIANFSNYRLTNDAIGIPRLGIRFADILHLPQTAVYGVGQEVDNRGNKVVGFGQGSLFNTPDTTPSKDIEKIYDMAALAHDEIRDRYAVVQNFITSKTKQYYKDSNRSNLERLTIGLADGFHKVFIKDMSTLTVKNPYDMSEDLKSHEREYLKTLLWEIYRHKKLRGKSDFKKTHEEVAKSEEFSNYILDSDYLKLPLIKKLDATKYKSISTTSLWKSLKNRAEDFLEVVDSRNITNTQRTKVQEHVETLDLMFNEFDMLDPVRDSLIAEYSPEYFEINLDTIALKYIYSNIKETVMNTVLPSINAAAYMIKYSAYLTGNEAEITKSLEDLTAHLRISIYGVKKVSSEAEDVISAIGSIQKIASFLYIPLRTALFFKELVHGTIKNVSYAWLQIYGDDSFTVEDLTKAYNTVLFSKDQSILDFTKVDNINMRYSITNMDLNNLVKHTKTDRTGAFRFFSEHLYWLNSAPDYVNRLTLSVAKMIHDGSYDAHYMDGDEFKYDPRLDKRFITYFAKREQYNFRFSGKDKEYDDQRSLYVAMLEDFNQENKTLNKPLLIEKTDLITKAYTHKELESMRNFSDTAYGYYNHERSAAWKQTAMGSIFGQFLTYWPTKVKYYFGKEQTSKKGQYQHEYEEINGKKEYYYLKDEFDIDGNLIGTVKTLENTGIKSIIFTGNMFEGLFYSLIKTGKDLRMGNIEQTPEWRVRNAKLAIHDMIMGMIIASLLRIMLEGFQKEKDLPYIQQAMRGTTSMLYKAMNEYNAFTSIFNAFRWEPAFVGMLSKVSGDVSKVVSGDMDISKMVRNNWKALEILPDIQ